MDYEMILMSVRRRIYTERNELQIQQAEALKVNNYMRAWSTQLGIVAMEQVLSMFDDEEQAEMERQTAATQPAEPVVTDQPTLVPVDERIIVEDTDYVDPAIELFDGGDEVSSESLDDLVAEEGQ